MNLRWRINLWWAQRCNRREIKQIMRSESYSIAVQMRDWEWCDDLLAEALDRQFCLSCEKDFLTSIRGAGL